MLENNEANKNEEVVGNNAEDVKKENETTEELKKEASKTVNTVKDTIKNTNIKEDSIETKNFIKAMLSKPATKLKEVVEDAGGKTLKYALIILAVWVIAIFVGKIIGGVLNLQAGTAIWSILQAMLSPVLGIIIFSVLVLIFNKDNKKSLITILSTMTIANVPNAFASVVVLLNAIPGQVYRITSPVVSFCSVLTVILMYFSTKSILNKNDDKAIKTFVIIEAIYLIINFVLSFMNIYI